MKIFNVRLGLANNSSSSHSLIFVKGAKDLDNDVETREFGWSYFTAGSDAAKRSYLAMTLDQTLRSITSPEMAEAIVSAWVGNKADPDGHIDHQSVYALPLTWDEKGIDKQFFDEFSAFLLQDNLAILGGNDNDETKHPLDKGKAFQLKLPLDASPKGWVARKDSISNYWMIFNRNNGTKLRFSFDPKAKPPTKAEFPELVDLKITDHCPYGCEFCYQGSTAKGQHADTGKIRSLAYLFSNAKIPEVAIGGGEPTLHPDFIPILETFRANHVIPNFTTKNLAWLRDFEVWPEVMKYCGSFAYSVTDAEEVKKLHGLLVRNNIDTERVCVQYVMGSTDMYEFESILTIAGELKVPVTLLGYKTTGRGHEYTPKEHSNWIGVLKKLSENYIPVRIDTALALEFEEELKKNKIPSWMYHTKEGKFSLYVDAVTNKMGPSSYCESILMRRVDLGKMRLEQLGKLYRHF